MFGAVEPKAGRHFSYPSATRKGAEVAQVVENLAAGYAHAGTIHLVVDNLNIHCRKPLVARFGEERATRLWQRFTLRNTPKHGSWLNQAEIEIGLFSRQCLGTRRIADLRTLRAEAKAWNRRINRDRVQINWKFTSNDARSIFHYQTNLFTRSKQQLALDGT